MNLCNLQEAFSWFVNASVARLGRHYFRREIWVLCQSPASLGVFLEAYSGYHSWKFLMIAVR